MALSHFIRFNTFMNSIKEQSYSRLLQFKSANNYGKICIRFRPVLIRHLLRNCLLAHKNYRGHDLQLFFTVSSYRVNWAA